MLVTTRSSEQLAAALSEDTLRSSTRNRKLNSKPPNVRQHSRNNTSSAWCAPWDRRIAGPAGNRQLRSGRRPDAGLDCGHRSSHSRRCHRCTFRRCLLACSSHRLFLYPYHKCVGKRALNVIFASLARGSLFMRAESKGVSTFTEGIQRLKRPKFRLLPREQLLLHPYRAAFQTVLLIRTIAWTPRFPN